MKSSQLLCIKRWYKHDSRRIFYRRVWSIRTTWKLGQDN